MRRSTGGVAVGVVLALAIACSRSSLDQTAHTVTTSARQPRPDTTATTSRTIDSTGWVDNGGRTNDEVARTELSGFRPTELGGERPTGTPGSGTPIPIPIGPKPPPTVGEGAGARGGAAGMGRGAPPETIVGRVARARCDRETTCDRVGEGKSFATGEQCMSIVRGGAVADVMEAACPRGFDETQLALCLTAIRSVECDAQVGTVETLPDCERSAICVP